MSDNPILELRNEEFNSVVDQIKYIKFTKVHDVKDQC